VIHHDIGGIHCKFTIPSEAAVLSELYYHHLYCVAAIRGKATDQFGERNQVACIGPPFSLFSWQGMGYH
jgi:hypothetical protein